jgi:hypothetical protein|tara:strand:+ start:3387 stop:3749 length:363 start_codon:yes stop_codon:yes gene_type:complete
MGLKKETNKPKALKYFVGEQHVSFKLKKGKHTIEIGEPALGGKEFAVYINMKSDTAGSTWSIDLVTSGDYKETRTIPNNVTTTWHHIKSNTLGTTKTSLIITSTSGDKDITALAEIKINN